MSLSPADRQVTRLFKEFKVGIGTTVEHGMADGGAA